MHSDNNPGLSVASGIGTESKSRVPVLVVIWGGAETLVKCKSFGGGQINAQIPHLDV
jgi:hypothetical protein